MASGSRPVRIVTICAAVAAARLTVAAFHGTQPSPRADERTFIGCIEKDRSTADFFLTHANQVRRDRAALGTGTYRLATIGNVKLAELAGHKVRVVGSIEREPPRTGKPEPPGPPDERGLATGDTSNAAVFRVSSVRSLAGTCP